MRTQPKWTISACSHFPSKACAVDCILAPEMSYLETLRKKFSVVDVTVVSIFIHTNDKRHYPTNIMAQLDIDGFNDVPDFHRVHCRPSIQYRQDDKNDRNQACNWIVISHVEISLAVVICATLHWNRHSPVIAWGDLKCVRFLSSLS